MEKIDRELLIKEISARLPYGVKAKVYGWDEEKGEVEIPLRIYSINTDGYVYFETNDYNVDYLNVDDCLLYLRPMSSMTEEEKNELKEYLDAEEVDCNGFGYSEGGTFEDYISSIPYSICIGVVDWLNAHHFDFRNLIEKGLAIEVTEKNNPYETGK